uniref:Chorismate lyase n=1 Tax=Laurencieae sp. TaxID=2007162 RepID=A0A1Z1M290_9FLOR|nr:hypothetical protein [Laurencieae sp.]
MNFHINTFYTFYAICVLPLNKIDYWKYKLSKIKANNLNMLIRHEGSLTRSINYMFNKQSDLQRLQRPTHKLIKQSRSIRCIWITKYIYTNLTLARSLWVRMQKNATMLEILSGTPIGESVLNYNIDTDKTIHELYYGYFQTIGAQKNNTQILWGRKYTLYYKNTHSITIQEFFSNESIIYLTK